MTITRIIKGPYRFAGFFWVDVECDGNVQRLMRSTEQQAHQIVAEQTIAKPSDGIANSRETDSHEA